MNEDKNRNINQKRKEKTTILKNWERDLRRGLLQLMILMLIRLRTQEAHGYGLIKLIQETGIELKAGTIYALLKRMEKDGLITSIIAFDPEADDSGLPKKFYTITEYGDDMIEGMVETYSSYHESINMWYQEINNQNIKRTVKK
ncbi:MAG: PadR family transcriptional regulator [Candidatus Hodarchaeota archaeon]